MFKENLQTIMNDLKRIEMIDKNSLFESKVQEILDASYKSYSQNLKINYDYLLYRDTLKVLKNIKREKEKKHEV